jgi:hypothetical protein
LTVADCPENNECTANACVPYASCVNSLDCPPQMVCNSSTQRCVQCVAAADCGEDQRCVADVCRKACASDIACTPMRQLCDKTNGYCVECLEHQDCATPEHCATGKCVADLCAPGEGSCVGSAIAACLPTGQNFGPAVACPPGESCSTTSGSARCLPGGSGGSGGGGGAGSMIDDMEDGDQRILNVAARTGYWRAWNDGTGTQSPSMTQTFLPQVLEAPRGASTRAMHTSGSGFLVWGAVAQLDFNNPASGINGGIGSPGSYGVSGYSGISFYARGTSLRVEVRTLATMVVAEGGSCTSTCNDHHGANVTLSSSWTPVSVAFSALTQRGFGTPVAFSPDQVVGLQFLPSATTFDYWIDDLAFY